MTAVGGTVGVVGTSARAAVHSLARAGFSAWAVDQFADRDLTRVALCLVCPPNRYPDALPELAWQFPPGPILYTGGLENHPHIIAKFASQRELWGNPPEVLSRVRDPFTLFRELSAAGFSVPRLVPHAQPCPQAGRWLRKPLRSAGGFGIRFAQPGEAPAPHHYFQEFIAGLPMSALYCGTTLLGITQQLIGEPWLHAKPFAYCGNIGPLDILPATHVKLLHLGRSAVESFGLREHWGVDFLLSGEASWPLEVNPRYTASLEVIEQGTGRSVFPQWGPAPERIPRGIVSKAIYFAPQRITFPHSGPWDADLAGDFDPWHVPQFADIPQPGAVIEPGWPVLSFFATGSMPEECRGRLQSRAAELDRLFEESTT